MTDDKKHEGADDQPPIEGTVINPNNVPGNPPTEEQTKHEGADDQPAVIGQVVEQTPLTPEEADEIARDQTRA
jgi:hypothetical protein